MSIGKNAPTRACALCLNVRPLVESHVVPRWVYKRMAEMVPARPVPVAIEDGIVMFKSDQLADYLLCRPCEDTMGRWDNYASKVSYNKGSFPGLEHALAHVVPDPFNTPKVTISDVSGLDARTLVLFGTSVLWRAAASPHLCPSIRLGPYFDRFLGYLLSEGSLPFPERARLLLHLLHTPEAPEVQQLLMTPGNGKNRSSHLHRFGVFGMCFELFTGGQHLRSFDGGCLAGTSRAVVTNGYRHVPDLYTQAKAATPKGGFAKHIGRTRSA